MSRIIRLATPEDASQIAKIYHPIVRDTHISFEQTPPNADEMAGRIQGTLQQYPWLVYEIDCDIAAYAYGGAFRARPAYQWTAETTVYVHADWQRRGLSRAIYRSLLAILRRQGYCNAVGVIALPNPASIRAHESLGFGKVGIFRNAGYKAGAWHDTGWWQLQLRPMPAEPSPPMPIRQLAQREDFDDMLKAGLTAPQKVPYGDRQ